MGDHLFEEREGELSYRYEARRMYGPKQEPRPEPEPLVSGPDERMCITCKKIIGLGEEGKIMGVRAYHMRTGEVRHTHGELPGSPGSACFVPDGWSRFKNRNQRELIVRDSEGNQV